MNDFAPSPYSLGKGSTLDCRVLQTMPSPGWWVCMDETELLPLVCWALVEWGAGGAGEGFPTREIVGCCQHGYDSVAPMHLQGAQIWTYVYWPADGQPPDDLVRRLVDEHHGARGIA